MATDNTQDSQQNIQGIDPLDPYARYDRNLDAAASILFLITPSDDEPLWRGIKRIRIYNSTEEVLQVTLKATRSEDPVTLAVPPLSIIWEDLRVDWVYDTGTDTGLVLHGYSD